jgi:hypothetical protein
MVARVRRLLAETTRLAPVAVHRIAERLAQDTDDLFVVSAGIAVSSRWPHADDSSALRTGRSAR